MKRYLLYFKFFCLGTLLAMMSVFFNIGIQLVFGAANIEATETIKMGLLASTMFSTLSGAIFEEILFRMLLLNFLIKILKSNWAAIFIESLIFALLHAANPNVTDLALFSHFLGGLIYSYAYVKIKKIWLPIGLHFGWNYMQELLGVPMSGSLSYSFLHTSFSTDPVLSGGEYGFEGGLFAFFSRLFLLFFLYFLFDKRKTAQLTKKTPRANAGLKTNF